MIFIRSCETIATADGWKYTIHTYYYLLVRKIKTNISAPIDFDVFISLPFCCCFFLDFSHFYTNNKNLKIEKKEKIKQIILNISIIRVWVLNLS